MGGEFQGYVITLKEGEHLNDKFQRMVFQAQYDHGHSGYSGTFAEKPGVVIIPIHRAQEDEVNPVNSNYWTREGAYNHALNHNGKWEDANAYELGPRTWYIGGWCSS